MKIDLQVCKDWQIFFFAGIVRGRATSWHGIASRLGGVGDPDRRPCFSFLVSARSVSVAGSWCVDRSEERKVKKRRKVRIGSAMEKFKKKLLPRGNRKGKKISDRICWATSRYLRRALFGNSSQV